MMSMPSDQYWLVDAKELSRLDLLSPTALRNELYPQTRIVVTRDLLTTANLSAKLMKLDAVLATDGVLEIDCIEIGDRGVPFRRSCAQIQYAIGCLFHDTYILFRREGAVQHFRKCGARRSYGDRLQSLSIGIISDGSKLPQLERIFTGIIRDATLPVELLLCGPTEKLGSLLAKFPEIRHLPDPSHEDLRAPINRKKWLIIQAAQCENLVIAHDRYFFDRAWFEQLSRYGNWFDFYNCRWCDIAEHPKEIHAAGDHAFRIHPLTAFTYHSGSGWAKEADCNPDHYLNGGLYIGKTRLFKEIGWPEFLHWGDMEDVHFSRQLQLDGWVVLNDWSNRIFTTTHRLGRFERPWYIKGLGWLRSQGRKARFWLEHHALVID